MQTLTGDHWKIHVADVMEGLAKIPAGSVHCVVTSPPYWQLRDYGFDGQIGLEKTPEEFIDQSSRNKPHRPAMCDGLHETRAPWIGSWTNRSATEDEDGYV